MPTDELIAALEQVGRVDSVGEFSLDREKAREKLRSSQVAEPRRYVLHLVALATLKGASAIDVECDSDDLYVRFDGAPVTAEDLDDLYNSSFAAARSDEQRARQQLAIGLHAALALNPRHVRLTSGSVVMVARPGRPDEISRTGAVAAWTQIHVKQRLRPGLLVRFVGQLGGDLAEATWLRERGRHSSVPISLNGRVISEGLRIRGTVHAHGLECDGVRAVAGLRTGRVGSGGVIRLVRHGVWIDEQACPWMPAGMLAVVSSGRLRTDLSGSSVVQDGEHASALALARDVAAMVVAAAIGPGDSVVLDERLAARLEPVWDGWPGALDPRTEIGAAMARVVSFHDTWGRSHSLASLHAVVAARGHLPTASGSFVGRLTPDDEVVYQRGDPRLDARIDQALGDRCRDVTAELEQRVLVESSRRRWRAQPDEPRLNAANYLLTAPFMVKVGDRTVIGEAGVRRAAGVLCSLRVIVDGCTLAELELDAPIAGVDAVIAGPLTVLADCSGPARDDLLAAALVAWIGASRVLAEAALRGGLLEWPAGVASEALRHGLLRAFHRDEALRATLCAGGYAEDELSRHQLELRDWLPETPVPPDMARETWMRDSFQFTTVAGQNVGPGAIAAGLEQGLPLAWVPEEYEGHPGITEPVLRTTPREREVLRWLFAGRVRRMERAEHDRLRGEAILRARPEVGLGLPAETHLPGVVVERAGLRVAMAVIGTRAGWHASSYRASCRIDYAGRPLAEVKLWSPVRGIDFAIAGDHLTPRATFDGVVPDDAYHAALLGAAAAVPALVERALVEVAADHAGEVGAAWRRCVLAALAATYPTPTMRAVHVSLLARCDRAIAEAAYLRLMALGAACGVEALSLALDEHVSDAALLQDTRELATRMNAPPPDDATVAAIGAVLAELRVMLGQTGGYSWLHDIDNPSPEVAALPLLERVDGSRMTLAGARIDAKGRGLYVYVTRGDGRPDRYLRSVRVDPATRDLLACLFGGHSVRDEAPPLTNAGLPTPDPGPAPSHEPPRPPEPIVAAPVKPPPIQQDLFALFDSLTHEAGESRHAHASPTVMPEPDPGERLVAAIRAELAALRRGHESLLTGFNLDHVRAVRGDGRTIVDVRRDCLELDQAHPQVERALARHVEDPLWVSFLASCVYTALNVWREDITDVDEAAFHTRHLRWLCERLGAPTA